MRVLAWIGCLFAGLMLLAAGALMFFEKRWAQAEPLSPEDAYLRGDIGLEIAPLKYLLVMDDPRLGGDVFSPGRDDTAPVLGSAPSASFPAMKAMTLNPPAPQAVWTLCPLAFP